MKKLILAALLSLLLNCTNFLFVSSLNHLVIYDIEPDEIIRIDTVATQQNEVMYKVKYKAFKVKTKKNKTFTD